MNIKRTMGIYFLTLMLSVISATVVHAEKDEKTSAEEFPGRKLYLDVKHISLEDLNQQFDKVTIVDVRSKYEYDTLHIKNAVNISINSESFVEQIQELRNKKPNSPVVMYCNGTTCMKSYKAARKCQSRGIDNVIAYDAGVLTWGKTYPDKSVLLGVSPIDPKKIIGKAEFEKHLLSPNDFIARANQRKTIILDVRDPLQRDGVSLFMLKEKRASLADKASLDKYIDQANAQNLPLMIYDEAGKQVVWLMYYLEDKNVAEYYFMKGGSKAYFGDVRKEYLK